MNFHYRQTKKIFLRYTEQCRAGTLRDRTGTIAEEDQYHSGSGPGLDWDTNGLRKLPGLRPVIKLKKKVTGIVDVPVNGKFFIKKY